VASRCRNRATTSGEGVASCSGWRFHGWVPQLWEVPHQKNEGRRSARGRTARGHDTRAERERAREREAVAEASYGHNGAVVYEREWRRQLKDLRDETEMHRWGEETG
jgi:hypothetical protein